LPDNRIKNHKWNNWSSNSSGNIAYKEILFVDSNINQSFELNHQTFLRRYLTIRKDTFIQYPVYKKDALDTEIELLEGLIELDNQ
jgi:DNA gyrase/topoisomerase IV subunit A